MKTEQQQLLAAALAACPRKRKKDIQYARQLKQHEPLLDNRALAKGSGATVTEIGRDPKINPRALAPEQEQLLAAALEACPRKPKEKDLQYARRLKDHESGLGNPALAKGSGATVGHIEGDPRLTEPALAPEELQWLNDALAACPREPKEKDLQYARRLKDHEPRLGNPALAKGSGTTVNGIARDPRINTPALAPQQQRWLDAAVAACPRTPKERWDLHYARRLKKHESQLDNSALAKGSGAKVDNIKQDPKINPPALAREQQQLLEAAVAACPRTPEEMSDLHYARRLRDHELRLDYPALAKGSGALATNIERDPKINPPVLTPEQQQLLQAALAACSRTPQEADIQYACRLKDHESQLGNPALAKGSGATVGQIESYPKINPPVLSPEQQQWLDAALVACPRSLQEKANIRYAHRLQLHESRLDHVALARGSGATVSKIIRKAKKW